MFKVGETAIFVNGDKRHLKYLTKGKSYCVNAVRFCPKCGRQALDICQAGIGTCRRYQLENQLET